MCHMPHYISLRNEFSQLIQHDFNQFRRVNILRRSAAVPACNVECSVHWNHQVVFGAVKDGWTHRKANHQTWGREIRVRKGSGGGHRSKRRIFTELKFVVPQMHISNIHANTPLPQPHRYIDELQRHQITAHVSGNTAQAASMPAPVNGCNDASAMIHY